MSALVEVWRHTFPKNLRYDRQSIILHAQISSVVKRYKFKRYIPRRDLMDIVENYAPLPFRFLRWPLIRSPVRLINGIRVLRGKQSWLTSKHVEIEHQRLREWMRTHSTHQFVERERFERELLNEFHVATLYHRMFLFLGTITALTATLLLLCEFSEYVVYLYEVVLKGKNREEMIAYYRAIVEQHATASYTEAYKDKLPAPCLLNPKDGYYYLQLVELESPANEGGGKGKDGPRKSILFIPFPMVGTEDVFDLIGQVTQQCDGVVLEHVPLEHVPVLPPAAFFPMKTPYFSILGLTTRYWAILQKTKEPPQLFPGAKKQSYRHYIASIVTPMSFRYFYSPFFNLDRGAARVGWGRIKEALDDPSLRTLAVPWNIHQIANLEASLFRQGWRLRLGPKVRWIRPEQPGEAFCDYFNVPARATSPVATLKAAAAAQ